MEEKKQILFHEPEYYFLDNFSAFQVNIYDHDFATAEHAYQWRKFPSDSAIAKYLLHAKSAHAAAMVGRANKDLRDQEWHKKRWSVMFEITQEKLFQHDIIQHKLLENRWATLVENSTTDSFWGDGPDGSGENHLGRLWMLHRDILIAYHQSHMVGTQSFRDYYTEQFPRLGPEFSALLTKFPIQPIDHRAYPDMFMALDQLNHAHATGDYSVLRRTHGLTVVTPVPIVPTDVQAGDDRDYHDHPEL